MSQTIHNKLVTPDGNPVGNRPSYSSCRRTRRRPLWGSDQGRSLLDAVQAAEGLPRPTAYALKGRDSPL
jgi:hypothetical protein